MHNVKKELKGRVALVTGASRGIGKAIAIALAGEGAEVILCARTREKLEEVKSEIEAGGGIAHSSPLDATNIHDVEKLFSETIKKIGALDILVNNVGGVSEHETFTGLKDEQWRQAFEFNVMPAIYFSRAALPYLKKSDNARIITISSVAGKQPGAFNPHYGIAKAALNHLTKVLANDFAKDHILVNTICPGTVHGGIWEDNVGDKAKRMNVSTVEAEKLMEEEIKQKTPLGTIATPEDIAELAVFLASPRSKSITGTCIAVDGGYLKSVY